MGFYLEGLVVGFRIGAKDDFLEGLDVGVDERLVDGMLEGFRVGRKVGFLVGFDDGLEDDLKVGIRDGADDL